MTQSKQPLPESIRRLDTPEGTIFYVLRRKRVKNLNLRLGGDSSICGRHRSSDRICRPSPRGRYAPGCSWRPFAGYIPGQSHWALPFPS